MSTGPSSSKRQRIASPRSNQVSWSDAMNDERLKHVLTFLLDTREICEEYPHELNLVSKQFHKSMGETCESLRISDARSFDQSQLVAINTHLSQLKKLVMEFNNETCEHPLILNDEQMNAWLQLTHLVLVGLHIKDGKTDITSRVFANLQSLTISRIFNNREITMDLDLIHLRILHLSHLAIDETSLLRSLLRCPHVEELELEALRHVGRLHTLILPNARRVALKHLESLIRVHFYVPKLRSISVDSCVELRTCKFVDAIPVAFFNANKSNDMGAITDYEVRPAGDQTRQIQVHIVNTPMCTTITTGRNDRIEDFNTNTQRS